MSKLSITSKIILCLLITILASCGGSGSSTATQYTLNVEGTMAISPTGDAQVAKLTEQQVLIGATILEVSNDTAQELGVNFLDFDVTPQATSDVQLQLILNPQVTSSGIVFKTCELGVPFGTSYFDLNLAVTSQSDITFLETGTNVLIDDGQTLVIGGLRAEAEADDRSRVPMLSDIPVINFLFQGQEHQAQVQSLIIILTPQILDDTHG